MNYKYSIQINFGLETDHPNYKQLSQAMLAWAEGLWNVSDKQVQECLISFKITWPEAIDEANEWLRREMQNEVLSQVNDVKFSCITYQYDLSLSAQSPICARFLSYDGTRFIPQISDNNPYK